MSNPLKKLRNPACDACKMHQGVEKVCEMGHGHLKAKIMVVSRLPNSGAYQDNLHQELAEVGFEPSELFYTQALKCRNFEANSSATDVKACRPYLEAEIDLVKPKWILAFGNEALLSLTGHSGIMKYRGRVIDRSGTSIFPTISPAAVNRNPGQRAAWVADLRLFAAQVYEKSATVPPPDIFYVLDKKKFAELERRINSAHTVSLDIETHGRDEFDPDGGIVSLSVTTIHHREDGQDKVLCSVIPLHHPESPFRKIWREVVERLTKLLARVQKRIAHNGKFDCRWLTKYGGVHITPTFDTMLAAHLLDENRQKGLKPQGSSRLGVAPWGIDTKDLLNTPIKEVMEYNALDTYYTYHIYLQLRDELIAQPRLARIFKLLVMPMANKYIKIEHHGVWCDFERLATTRNIAEKMITELEGRISDHIPKGSDEELIELGWPRMGRRTKLAVVNFNPSNWSRWWLFDYMGYPILARGKQKPNGDPGDPSMAEAIMLELKQQERAEGGPPLIETMLERTRWTKMLQFVSAYEELADENDRIHTTFKQAGTVTGRTSSGRADEEKITASRDRGRGVNLQQVPRDALIRGIFGAPIGYDFIEADFSQVELRIAAFLSRDRTMLHLYQTGQDIHRATAAWVLGIPASQIDKEARKKAKAVNFGFVYGMGWRKFIATAFEKYELTFSEAEAQGIRKQFFAQFSGLMPWHSRQRRLVHEYARVQSPIGRIRHLPDIRSADPSVVAEAERQAINSPVQSFGSDMMLLSLILIDEEFKRKGIDAHILGSVHDSGLFEVRKKDTAKALPIIKRTMENLPLQKKFGVNLDVPIVADIKIGGHWAGDDVRELTEEEVYNYKAA